MVCLVRRIRQATLVGSLQVRRPPSSLPVVAGPRKREASPQNTLSLPILDRGVTGEDSYSRKNGCSSVFKVNVVWMHGVINDHIES